MDHQHFLDPFVPPSRYLQVIDPVGHAISPHVGQFECQDPVGRNRVETLVLDFPERHGKNLDLRAVETPRHLNLRRPVTDRVGIDYRLGDRQRVKSRARSE